MAVLVCLAAIIIWSPLHTHQNGKCSLNNLEVFISDQVAADVPLPAPTESHFFEAAAERVAAVAMEPRELPARAPPSSLA